MSRVTDTVPLEKGPAGFFVVSSFPRELLSLLIVQETCLGWNVNFFVSTMLFSSFTDLLAEYLP